MPVEEDLTGVDLVDAGQALHQSRFSGAVVPDQGSYLPRVHAEVDVMQHMHRAEALVDVAHFQKRGFGHNDSCLPARVLSEVFPRITVHCARGPSVRACRDGKPARRIRSVNLLSSY